MQKTLIQYKQLTPWLMEPGGSMPHSQGLSNNSYPEPNQPDKYNKKIKNSIKSYFFLISSVQNCYYVHRS